MKLGELIGRATRKATLEALRWQNGLEASYTRGVFHALGRFGVREATLFDDIAPFLSEADLELLKKNSKAAFYEPLVGAAAHALAVVCDRVRYGTIPGVGRRRCDGAAGGNARGESGGAGPPMARVPLHAAAICDRRREGAGAPSGGARLVGEVAHG